MRMNTSTKPRSSKSLRSSFRSKLQMNFKRGEMLLAFIVAIIFCPLEHLFELSASKSKHYRASKLVF